MKPKYMYEWREENEDPPWLVWIAGFLWALVVVLGMFI